MSVRRGWSLGWVAVAVVNLGAMQLARISPSPASAAPAAGFRRGCWSATWRCARSSGCQLPLYLFPQMDPATQVIAASVMAGLGIAALGLVVIPPCVTAWMVAFTAGVGGSLLHRAPFGSVPAHALDPVHARASQSSASLTVARWAFHQLKTNADVGSQSESASLLLQEYEQRGVGWLWQIDARESRHLHQLADERPARQPCKPAASAIRCRRCSAAMPSLAGCCSKSRHSTRSRWS